VQAQQQQQHDQQPAHLAASVVEPQSEQVRPIIIIIISLIRTNAARTIK